MNGAIAQVHIDEALIRQVSAISKVLKILDRLAIQSDRHRLLQQLDIRVPAALHPGKIIVVSHSINPSTPLALVCLPYEQKQSEPSVSLAVTMTHDQN